MDTRKGLLESIISLLLSYYSASIKGDPDALRKVLAKDKIYVEASAELQEIVKNEGPV